MRTAERFRAPEDGRLTPAMKEAYGRDGLLVLEGFADEEAIAALRRRIDELVEEFDADIENNRGFIPNDGERYR